MANILFRVDAGNNIGLGHLQRCLALATVLSEKKIRPFFLTGAEALGRVTACGFSGTSWTNPLLGTHADFKETVEMAREHQCEAIVVDSFFTDASYLENLRREDFFIMVMDDVCAISFPCHMVVNGNVHAPECDYSSTSGDTLFLLGPQYAILRSEFQNFSKQKKQISASIKNILVTVGGTDQHRLTSQLLSGLEKISAHVHIWVVIGPFFEEVDLLKEQMGQSRHPIHWIHAPLSLAEFLPEIDLAISGAGQTLYELAAAGIPTIAVQIASNQEAQLKGFEKAGFLYVAGQADDPKIIERVRTALDSLWADQHRRAEMSAIGKDVVDGQGIYRVADVLIEQMDLIHPQVFDGS